jgi:hypothetical protein
LLEEDEELPRHRAYVTSPVQDAVVQGSPDLTANSSLSPLSINSGLNLLGMGTGFPGYSEQGMPPDANGAAGTTQFVEFVNDSFAVFNKTDGSVAYGPASGNTLWQALGAPCSTSPNLDETVEFDKLANRWVMLMPVFTSPDQLCVAVSQTSDATASGWNLYVFPIPGRMMPDYPKLAVWPDGYYLTYNQGRNLVFVGDAACVFDRNSMLKGAAATMQCFTNINTSYGGLLPADLDGTIPPPVNSPESFLNFDGNDQSLDLWQFHVDWTTPANSTFTGPTNIPVANFVEACGESAMLLNNTTGACVPQVGTTQMLDSFGDRVMYRLAYRNFADHQSLLVNHTVTAGTNSYVTGVRWYELQNTGSGFGVYQQGTFSPDTLYRWMGSIAMDQAGDIALGYSVSSATMSPSIRYTGRVPSDTLGQMESEVDVLAAASVAHGSQTGSIRWGDYSSLAVDPADDCTFWFTTEYQPTNGNRWSTRIASFSFPSCTTTTPNYTLTVSQVGQGTVTSGDGKINCTNGSGTCSAVYASGSSVALNATATGVWTFSGWSGACTGGNPCNVMMTGNRSTTATFTAPTYMLTVNEVGQGKVTSTDGAIKCTSGSGSCAATYVGGSTVALNATAASGWAFSGWSGACNGGNPCNVVMSTNLTATATFKNTATWAIVNMASNGGSITNLTIPATGTGHLIAVAMMLNGGASVASISDNAGNVYVSAGARSTIYQGGSEIWYAVSSKSGATLITPTIAGSPTRVQITEWEVSGLSNVTTDAARISNGTVSSNTPGPAVTTTQAGDFIVSVLYANASNLSAISTGNEFTDDFKTYGNGWAHITSTSATAGTHQASWYTAAPSGVYCASTVAFRSN